MGRRHTKSDDSGVSGRCSDQNTDMCQAWALSGKRWHEAVAFELHVSTADARQEQPEAGEPAACGTRVSARSQGLQACLTRPFEGAVGECKASAGGRCNTIMHVFDTAHTHLP